MSKRFGRNQKRKLREQNALLWGALDIRDKQYRDALLQLVRTQETAKQCRFELECVHDALASAFNKYHPLRYIRTASQKTEMPEVMQIDQYEPSGRFYQTVLHLIKVVAWPDEYRKSAAIRVYFADKSVGYYLSGYEITDSKLTIDELSKKIATELDAYLRKAEKK